jgi:hypothetical protein
VADAFFAVEHCEAVGIVALGRTYEMEH